MSHGRPRDEQLDDAIVDAAARLLADAGPDAVTIARVAQLAGTTRPAVYRRFETATHLAVAALHRFAAADRPPPSGDHFADLCRELRSFHGGLSGLGTLSLVGQMLATSDDDERLATYRELIVLPRRSRLATILRAARDDGALEASDVEVDHAVTMCTGSYYAAALAGATPGRTWPRRTARLVWRALGGEPPASGSGAAGGSVS